MDSIRVKVNDKADTMNGETGTVLGFVDIDRVDFGGDASLANATIRVEMDNGDGVMCFAPSELGELE